LENSPVARAKEETMRPAAPAAGATVEPPPGPSPVPAHTLRSEDERMVGSAAEPRAWVTAPNKIATTDTDTDRTLAWRLVRDRCRGRSSFPGAWFEHANAGRIKVLRSTKASGAGEPGRVLDDELTVACGEGAIRLLELQRAGRQPLYAAEFLRGTPV